MDKLLAGHTEDTGGRTGRITEEIKAKQNVLEISMRHHVEIKNNDIQSIRQELIKAKQQIKTISV